MSDPWKKLIVALDLTNRQKAEKIIRKLSNKIAAFKIGPIAYFKCGQKLLQSASKNKARVFLDFKLYDIPNTMLEAAKNFIDQDIWAFTVHAKAGKEALSFLKKGLIKEARRKKRKAPLIIGVTELTSKKASKQSVLKLAKTARDSGLDGVVCSVWEAKDIKKKYKLLTITPGIRSKKTDDDQKRVATVSEAIKQGSDYFVVGRPIVGSRDYLKAAEELLGF
ncbi:MAG: orotidine-5'-phosphate decarboxylase [Candidatus Omnitrophica bacterium]|nr:orotidine-5'-phosphate decarboxylase [Candidatus Omnitrophota bacterium]